MSEGTMEPRSVDIYIYLAFVGSGSGKIFLTIRKMEVIGDLERERLYQDNLMVFPCRATEKWDSWDDKEVTAIPQIHLP